MIPVDCSPYLLKIHRDHGNAKFGPADNRITATFRRP